MNGQRYISDELTHFVGRAMGADRKEQFALLLSIVKMGAITFPPHTGSTSAAVGQFPSGNIFLDGKGGMYSKQCVCFCDIPLQDLPFHAAKYSPFGIAFSKRFVVAAGGSPVFYVAHDAPTWTFDPLAVDNDLTSGRGPRYEDNAGTEPRGGLFQRALRAEMAISDDVRRAFESPGHMALSRQRLQYDWIRHFTVTNIFAFVKPFDSSLGESDKDNYYYEREWRLLGNMRFELSDIRRIFIPEEYAEPLRKELPRYYGQLSFLS